MHFSVKKWQKLIKKQVKRNQVQDCIPLFHGFTSIIYANPLCCRHAHPDFLFRLFFILIFKAQASSLVTNLIDKLHFPKPKIRYIKDNNQTISKEPFHLHHWDSKIINNHLLCTISVDRSDIWIWSNYSIKEGDTFSVVRFLIKLQIYHVLHKWLERLWTEAAKRLWWCCHFLLANKKSFILTLLKSGTLSAEG